jgi:hypothetical protein
MEYISIKKTAKNLGITKMVRMVKINETDIFG